jgi:hypothetical protein
LTIFPASENLNHKTSIIRSKAQNIPNTQEESQDIRLFLFVELSNIFVCAHLAATKLPIRIAVQLSEIDDVPFLLVVEADGRIFP